MRRSIDKSQRVKMGKRLRECRKEKDLYQETLAQITGFARNTISRHESGTRSFNESEAKIYADALGVLPEYLLCVPNACKTRAEQLKRQSKADAEQRVLDAVIPSIEAINKAFYLIAHDVLGYEIDGYLLNDNGVKRAYVLSDSDRKFIHGEETHIIYTTDKKTQRNPRGLSAKSIEDLNILKNAMVDFVKHGLDEKQTGITEEGAEKNSDGTITLYERKTFLSTEEIREQYEIAKINNRAYIRTQKEEQQYWREQLKDYLKESEV